ncbi:type I glutamate--ammonia ligase [Candidatus Micrarchaeota archaeon CG_4_10_14_0_2_um_filter_49_7]|nr:MAG: type I glutamate--ammonia ligase [Candidatus Micrarchaeota archaeon CG_4_10_14_0_2_um_filter_49_7]
MALDEKSAAILADAKKKGVQFADLQFVDVLGTPKNGEITISKLEDVLSEGLWFDGSSIEGFTRIFESDMFLKPDPNTFAILPWSDGKVARIICDVYLDDKTPFEGDPRNVLKRNLKKAKEMGYEFYVGPELEFFLFKRDSNGNPTQVPHDNADYFDLAPLDEADTVRQNVVPALEAMGIEVEMSHHEVAPGQHEIDFRYRDALTIADSVITYKTVTKSIAKRFGLHASFMPKPVAGINGSGMHTHQSLWKDGRNAFFSADGKYKLSDVARHYIAGLIEHSRAITAVANPTVNSYKRLVPGYEAPVYICWAMQNRSALIRIPKYQEGKHSATRCEFRSPDPSCNPYLAFSAMLSAGLDGIKRKLEPPEPKEENLYELKDLASGANDIKTLPGSLDEAMAELKKDKVIQEALGEHVLAKLLESEKEQYDSYRLQVSKWEIDRYLGVI